MVDTQETAQEEITPEKVFDPDRILPSLDVYTIPLEDTMFYNDRKGELDFNDHFVHEQRRLFEIPEREQEVLDFYRNCANRLPRSLVLPATNVLKLGSKYYCRRGHTDFFNHDKKKCIKVVVVRNIDLNHYDGEAVKYLLSIVDGELDLPDKVLVRNIAIESFHNALERATNPDGNRFNLYNCVSVDRNEHALESLRQYGFRVNSWKFLEVDARSR